MQISSTRCSRCELRITAAPASARADDRRLHPADADRVEAGERLVEQQRPRARAAARTRSRASASCRARARRAARSACRASSSSSSSAGDARVDVGHPVEPADEAEVLLDGEVVEQVRLVGDEGEQGLGRDRLRGQVVPADPDPPAVGMMIPAMLRIVVVFPAPLGPTRPSTSPGCDREGESPHGREARRTASPAPRPRSRPPPAGRHCRPGAGG